MNKRNVILVLAGLLVVGCGKSSQGTYTGFETLSSPQQQGATTTQPGGYTGSYGSYGSYGAYGGGGGQVTLSLDEANGNFVSGTWSGQSGTFTFTGMLTGDKIEKITMTQSATPTAAASPSPYGGYNGGYNSGYSYGSYATCTYTGSLSLNDKTISGTLTAAGSASMGCPSRSVTANKTN